MHSTMPACVAISWSYCATPVILVDRDLRIRYWNAAAEETFGYSDEQAFGRVAHELLQTQSPIPIATIVEHVVATGRWEGGLVHQCRDGRRISIESRWGVWHDARGEARGFMQTGYDERDRTRYDNRLREAADYLVQQRQWLEAVLNLLPLPLLLVDPVSERVTFRNQAAEAFDSIGGQEDTPHTEHFTDMDGRRVPARNCRLRSTARGEQLDGDQFRWRRAESERTLMIHSVMLPAMHSHESVAVLLYQDITREKEHERELRRANQAKDALLAMLGHELRNPLAAITSAAELIQLLDPSNPTFDEARDILNTHIQHLVRLVDEMLDVSRLTSGKIRLRREVVDLREIVNLSVQSCEPMFASRRHIVQVSLPNHAVFVEGDAARLEQVVVNLLMNAAKYTDEDGRIDVSLRSGNEAEQAELRIRDNGIGISPEMLPQIFELFRQLNPSLHRAEGGLGIGLSVVKSLVELHGGSVVALSEGVGHGSEFVVLLPESLRHPTTDWIGSAPAPSRKLARGLRLLVVEDNVDVARTIVALLSEAGHEVQLAYDGPSALSAVHSFRPHVAFLDIGLPGMSGLELAGIFRNDPNLGHIYLVALTGFGQAEDRSRSLEAGFDEHLVKPVSLATLTDVLTAFTETSAAKT